MWEFLPRGSELRLIRMIEIMQRIYAGFLQESRYFGIIQSHLFYPMTIVRKAEFAASGQKCLRMLASAELALVEDSPCKSLPADMALSCPSAGSQY